LSDFGMSRQLEGSEYYRKTTDGMVPIKWMPIEAIEKKLFTHMSDSYSFGVLAWETMTLGSLPWSTRTPVETALVVAKGEVLPRPPLCPEDLYAFMVKTWSLDPDSRPSPRRIFRFFRGKCEAYPQQSDLTTSRGGYYSADSAATFTNFQRELDAGKAQQSQRKYVGMNRISLHGNQLPTTTTTADNGAILEGYSPLETHSAPVKPTADGYNSIDQVNDALRSTTPQPSHNSGAPNGYISLAMTSRALSEQLSGQQQQQQQQQEMPPQQQRQASINGYARLGLMNGSNKAESIV
jgi:serine/threonine protein kinase